MGDAANSQSGRQGRRVAPGRNAGRGTIRQALDDRSRRRSLRARYHPRSRAARLGIAAFPACHSARDDCATETRSESVVREEQAPGARRGEMNTPDLNAAPEPWDYNPSSWRQRIIIAIWAMAATLIAIYMGLYQWR